MPAGTSISPGCRPKTAEAFDHKGLVLYCLSFSKAVSPIARVGWLTPGKFYKPAHPLKPTLIGNPAIVPQLALAHALAGGGYDNRLFTGAL